MMESQKIEVKTPLGTLCAEVGGEPNDYPEIFVYLQRDDGVQIDLTCVSMRTEEPDMINAYLWEHPESDDWTRKHIWLRDDFKRLTDEIAK